MKRIITAFCIGSIALFGGCPNNDDGGGPAPTAYNVTYVADPADGGAIGGDRPAKAAEGDAVSFLVAAETGYTIESVSWKTDTGAAMPLTAAVGSAAYSFIMPGEAVTVTAAFEELVSKYNVTYVVNLPEGGTIGGVKPAKAKEGDTVSFTVEANAGYTLERVIRSSGGGVVKTVTAVDGVSDGSAVGYSFTMPGEDVTITAVFDGIFAFTTPQIVSPPAQSANFHIFLCIGQSNMAGRAALEEQDKRVIGGNALLYNAAGQWERAQPWLRGGSVNANTMEGLNRYSNVRKTGSDSSSFQGLNPAYYFADTLKGYVPAGVTIGLVVNARGDTSLAQWSKGYTGTDTRPDFDLYENTVARAQAAIASGGVLKGIIWHQGESDLNNTNYVSLLQDFIAALRADLGVTAAVPFVASELLSSPATNRSAFNNRMPAFVSTTLNTDYVKVPQTLVTIDGTHLDPAAQRVVGALFGQKMLKMAYNIAIE